MLIGEEWKGAASAANVVSTFQSTGTFLADRNATPDDCFWICEADETSEELELPSQNHQSKGRIIVSLCKVHQET
jgi:hypothetical protein